MTDDLKQIAEIRDDGYINNRWTPKASRKQQEILVSMRDDTSEGHKKVINGHVSGKWYWYWYYHNYIGPDGSPFADREAALRENIFL